MAKHGKSSRRATERSHPKHKVPLLKPEQIKKIAKYVDIAPHTPDPYTVARIFASHKDTITWKCPGHSIIVEFPNGWTPLPGGATQASGKHPLTVPLDPNASGVYKYLCTAIDKQGNWHDVVGNSPPEMVIE